MGDQHPSFLIKFIEKKVQRLDGNGSFNINEGLKVKSIPL